MRLQLGLCLVAALVALAVTIIDWPVLWAHALFLDDQQYVTENSLVQNPSWNSAARFLTEVFHPSTVEGYYQPLAMISLMLDFARGGRSNNLGAFHATSLTLHALNAALVVVLLHLLFRKLWISGLAGLLFGLHPVSVESLAWISERKTLLATLFVLISLIAYVAHAHQRTRPRYAIAFIAFLFALLSKPTSTPLPLLLILLDYWPLRRLTRRALVEKIPFFGLAFVFAIITIVSQSRAGTLTTPTEAVWTRIPLTLSYNIILYLKNLFWPVALTPYQATPVPLSLSNPVVLVAFIATTALLALLIVSLRWTRAPLTGWLFFFVAALPTMGILGFTHVIAADKYIYLPMLGFLLIFVAALSSTWDAPTSLHVRRWTRAGLCAVVLLAAFGEARLTHRQIGYWRDTASLYRRAIVYAPHVYLLHHGLGVELAQRGDLDHAAAELQAALQIDPASYRTYNSLGNVYRRQGRLADALQQYREVLRLAPQTAATVYNNMGTVASQQGDLAEAQAYYEKALQANPNIAEVHDNLGQTFARQAQWQAAATQHEIAIQLKPDFPEAHCNLGTALASLGQPERAAEQFRTAIALQADCTDAYRGLGQALLSLGKTDEAADAFTRGLRLAPDDPALRNGLVAAQSKPATAPTP